MLQNEPIRAIRGAKVQLFILTTIYSFSKKDLKVSKSITFKFF